MAGGSPAPAAWGTALQPPAAQGAPVYQPRPAGEMPTGYARDTPAGGPPNASSRTMVLLAIAAACVIAAATIGYVGFLHQGSSPTAATVSAGASTAATTGATTTAPSLTAVVPSTPASVIPTAPSADNATLNVSFTDPKGYFTALFPAEPASQTETVPVLGQNVTLYVFVGASGSTTNDFNQFLQGMTFSK